MFGVAQKVGELATRMRAETFPISPDKRKARYEDKHQNLIEAEAE